MSRRWLIALSLCLGAAAFMLLVPSDVLAQAMSDGTEFGEGGAFGNVSGAISAEFCTILPTLTSFGAALAALAAIWTGISTARGARRGWKAPAILLLLAGVLAAPNQALNDTLNLGVRTCTGP